jgi:hypothetical protein
LQARKPLMILSPEQFTDVSAKAILSSRRGQSGIAF